MKILVIFISLSLFISANSLYLESLVGKIKISSGDDRRVLMNKLKLQLRALNQEKRVKYILELKKHFNQNGAKGLGKGHGYKFNRAGNYNKQGIKGNRGKSMHSKGFGAKSKASKGSNGSQKGKH